MTPERQKQIEELRGRITPDEWDLCLDLPPECGLAWCRSHQEIQLSHAKITIHKDGYAGADYDAEFIAAAPQIVDELLSAFREVTEENARLAKAAQAFLDLADQLSEPINNVIKIAALHGVHWLAADNWCAERDALKAALSPSPSTTEEEHDG